MSSVALKINIVVGGRFQSEQIYVGLRRLGHDVRIYSSSPPSKFRDVPSGHVTFIPKLSQILKKVFSINPPRYISHISSVYFDLVMALVMRKADVIWGFNGDSWWSIFFHGKDTMFVLDRACPHILTQVATLEGEAKKIGVPFKPPTRSMIGRMVDEYYKADLIIVPSNYTAKSFFLRGFCKSKLFCLPLNGNATIPVANKIGRSDLKCSTFKIGVVGGAFLRKGLLHLLRAVESLSGYDIELLIRAKRSSFPENAEIERLLQLKQVTLISYVEDLNAFYQTLDCFVLPSVDEGFGMVVLEAMANGIAVICSENVGATDDMIAGTDFLQVPASDSESIRLSLLRLIEDTPLKKRLGRNGQEFVERRNLGISVFDAKLEQLNQLISKRESIA